MHFGTVRRRLRFSLRAMILVILVIGIWLGWQVNRAREQREAVAAVRRYGGEVHYEHEFFDGKLKSGRTDWAPRWLRQLVGDEFFRQVRQVRLVNEGRTAGDSITPRSEDVTIFWHGSRAFQDSRCSYSGQRRPRTKG